MPDSTITITIRGVRPSLATAMSMRAREMQKSREKMLLELIEAVYRGYEKALLDAVDRMEHDQEEGTDAS